MAVTNYHTVDGMILGQTTAGTRSDYLTDALGNVTATLDAAGKVINTYRYKPFGTQLAKTGVGADPRFQHVGAHGIVNTQRTHAEEHMRARHYSNAEGAFTTVDPVPQPIAKFELPYIYVKQNPIRFIDPSGLAACQAPRDPMFACADFLKDHPWPRFDNGIRKGGFVLCCGGKCVPCVDLNIGIDGDPWYECLVAHELDHCKRQNCSGKPFDEPPCVPDCPIDECWAGTAEMDCLMKALRKCGNDVECQNRLIKRMTVVCDYVMPFCLKAGKKFKHEKWCKEYT